MDNETSSYKRVMNEEDMDLILKRFHKRWDKRYEPELRHKIKVRDLIKENGGLVKHNKLVYLLRKEFGYNERITNFMIDYFIRQKIIKNLYFDSKMDLRYFVDDYKKED